MVVRQEIGKPWPDRQPGGKHHIRQEDILQNGRFLRFGYEVRAYAATAVPGQKGRLIMEITSAEVGPIEARSSRWAFAKIAMRMMAELKSLGLTPTRRRRLYVYEFRVWRYV